MVRSGDEVREHRDEGNECEQVQTGGRRAGETDLRICANQPSAGRRRYLSSSKSICVTEACPDSLVSYTFLGEEAGTEAVGVEGQVKIIGFTAKLIVVQLIKCTRLNKCLKCKFYNCEVHSISVF